MTQFSPMPPRPPLHFHGGWAAGQPPCCLAPRRRGTQLDRRRGRTLGRVVARGFCALRLLLLLVVVVDACVGRAPRASAQRVIVFAFVGLGIDPVACGLPPTCQPGCCRCLLAADGQSGSQAMASTTLSSWVLIIAAIDRSRSVLQPTGVRLPARHGRIIDPPPLANQQTYYIPRGLLLPIRFSDPRQLQYICPDPLYSNQSGRGVADNVWKSTHH